MPISRPVLLTIVLAIIFLALNLYAFYPGLVTSDSIAQFRQSLTGHYEDAHPPLMAATWRVLNEIYRGPELMLGLSLVLYWSCFTALAIYCVKSTGKWWSAAAILTGLFPFLLAFSGVIWKDVLLAASWGLSCAFLLLCTSHRDRPLTAALLWMGAILLLVFGTAMRYNAAPAGVVLALALARETPVGGKGGRATVFVALATLVIVAVPLSSRYLRAADSASLENLISWDLTGISYFSGQNYLVSDAQPQFVAKLDCYSPRLFDACQVLGFSSRGEALRRWAAAVTGQPLAYAKHRMLIFSMLLRAGCTRCEPYFWVRQSDPNPYQFEFNENSLHRALEHRTERLVRSPLGRPYVWWIAAFGLAAMAWRDRKTQPAATLALIAASGAVFALSYAPLTLTDEFRYLYWLIFSVLFTTAAIVFGSKDGGRFRKLALWVVLPVLLAGMSERLVRAQWPTDAIAPSMQTNY